jgi:hypothetical protein
MSTPHHLPSQSVDVAGIVVDDPEPGRRRLRHVSIAALVVAAVAWLAVFFVGVLGSETNGLRASWFAIFPTGVSIMGHVALAQGLRGGPGFVRALLAGAASSLLLWFFFEGIWPSL